MSGTGKSTKLTQNLFSITQVLTDGQEAHPRCNIVIVDKIKTVNCGMTTNTENEPRLDRLLHVEQFRERAAGIGPIM